MDGSNRASKLRVLGIWIRVSALILEVPGGEDEKE